ncbi:MAG: FKBP-type peptidyl-prolyl cis-trans isomerase [Lachnospiraceae bacterium]|nr:FKBP-type peptidyl-prolyl cis-trans isomerase [Lachnospiraceae bacterium]
MYKKKMFIGCAAAAVLVAAIFMTCFSEERAGTEEIVTETGTEKIVPETAEEGSIEEEITEEEIAEEENAEEENTEEMGAVILGDYTGFTYSRSYTAPTEADVEDAAESALSETVIEYEETGTVADGDAVILSMTGTVDGEEVEGIAETDSEVIVGDGTYTEDLEAQLPGLTVGEAADLEVSFPDDYWQEDLAGKTAIITVTVTGRADAPELTDEWVQENTNYSTVAEFMEYLEASLMLQAEEEADSSAIYSLLEDLVSASSAKVTEDEIEAEYEERLPLYEEDAEYEEMEFADYLEYYYGMDEEAFREALYDEIEYELEYTKIVEAFIKAEGVDVSDETFAEYLETEAAIYGYESGDVLYEELETAGYGDSFRSVFHEYQAGKALMAISIEIEADEADDDEYMIEIGDGDGYTMETDEDGNYIIVIEAEDEKTETE